MRANSIVVPGYSLTFPGFVNPDAQAPILALRVS